MSGAAHELSPVAHGARVAAARRAAGLTQKQLAELLHASPWAIERLEGGPRVPPAPARAARSVDLGALGRVGVLGAIVLLVTIRFATEVLPFLPRVANFVDVPLFVALMLAAAAVPARRGGRAYLALGLPATAVLLLAVASALLNAGHVQPAPLLVFVYGFLAPLAVYAAVYRVWQPGHAASLSRVLVALGLLQLAVVAVHDLPRFVTTGNPDLIGGTFGTNAYQLVFFLLVFLVLVVGIFTFEPRRAIAPLAPLLCVAVFAVVLLAQYRALLATAAVTVVAAGLLLGRRLRGAAIAAIVVVAFAVTFSHVAARFPGLKLQTTAQTLAQSPWSYAAQRAQATEPVRALYRDEPLAAVLGSGPGTFSSRAWQTFALAGSTSASNVQGGYARLLTGGPYRTEASERYVLPYLETREIVEGSRAVTSPYSSYLGLAAEVGLVGVVLVLGVYLAALARSARLARSQIARARPGDPLPALALATMTAFLLLLQMGLLENWLEVARVTFVAWAMLGVVCKELDARQDEAS
jgi:hypothetical protein